MISHTSSKLRTSALYLFLFLFFFWNSSWAILFYFFWFLFSHFFKNFIFKLYNIVLVLPNIEMNPPQVYPRSPSWTFLPLPSPPLPLGRPSAPAPSIQYHASNLDWRLVSYIILSMFQLLPFKREWKTATNQGKMS